jgi:cytochrome c
MGSIRLIGGAAAWLAVAAGAVAAEGDLENGKRAFRACAACHSLAPGRHLTGPSLAGVWGRQAGTVEGFPRYSEALKSADVVWNAETLDPWLADPQRFLPGNRMTFRGIKDERARGDLIAYLEMATTAEGGGAPPPAEGGMMGGMAPQRLNLKEAPPENQVTAVRYCGDTYHVTTAAGETIPFWEFNLRLKTDGGELGPPAGRPALLPAGMMGDRASVVFARPEEISAFIRRHC